MATNSGSVISLDSSPLSSGVAYAVLDRSGTIVAVNQAWRCARQTDVPFGPRFGIGANYREFCEFRFSSDWAALGKMLEAVLGGERAEARVGYECSAAEGRERFEMTIDRFETDGDCQYIVMHREMPEDKPNGTDAADGLDLLTGIYQEVRAPINGIIGMTDLVLETEVSRDQRDYLLAAKSSAQSLLALMGDMLDSSRIDAGELRLERVPFCLRASMAEILKPLASRAQGNGLELTYDVDPGVPEQLTGDPGRLRQILRNLVDNAIKFTKLGEIKVRCGLEQIDDRVASVRFDVIDTGLGIDDTQAGTLHTSGLGLKISSRLAELMGGRIAVTSDPGRGSTFSFVIPFHRDPSVARKPFSEDSGTCLPPMRILLAEDNPVNQRVARSMLEKWGHTVVIARNGREAIDLHAEQEFDLIFMDIEMPILDGIVACAVIRENEKGTDRRVPIVALTGTGMKPDPQRFATSGMNGALSKPLDPEELSAVLERATPEPRVRSRPAESGTMVVDREKLLVRTGRDRALLYEIIQMFLRDKKRILAPVSNAISLGDAVAVQRSARKLRTTFGGLAADRALSTTARLEEIAQTGDLSGAPAALERLRREADQLEMELRAMAGPVGRP